MWPACSPLDAELQKVGPRVRIQLQKYLVSGKVNVKLKPLMKVIFSTRLNERDRTGC